MLTGFRLLRYRLEGDINTGFHESHARHAREAIPFPCAPHAIFSDIAARSRMPKEPKSSSSTSTTWEPS